MKTTFKLVLFVSFLLVALFGFASMIHGSAHCTVSAMRGSDCPMNLFGFASFHISFFKSFSSAAFEGLGLFVLLLVLDLVAATPSALKERFLTAAFSFFKTADENGGPSPAEKVRSWLSLLETSPTFAIAR